MYFATNCHASTVAVADNSPDISDNGRPAGAQLPRIARLPTIVKKTSSRRHRACAWRSRGKIGPPER
jgi:hypothetical protein